jgi:hypothetical protein
MITGFLDVFQIGSPPIETLLSHVETADALHLRRTCKTMYTAVNSSSLSAITIAVLTYKLLSFDPQKNFSLKNAPESCKKNRYFAEIAVQRNALDLLFASKHLQDDSFLIKTALISAKISHTQADIQLINTIRRTSLKTYGKARTAILIHAKRRA